jgi:hypothetical protein
MERTDNMSDSIVNTALFKATDALDEAISELEEMSERALADFRFLDDRELVEQIAVLNLANRLISEHIV